MIEASGSLNGDTLGTLSGLSGGIAGASSLGGDLSFGFGTSPSGTQDATVTTDPGVITVTFPPINLPNFEPLVVVDDMVTTDEDSGGTIIPVLINDTAADTSLLVVTNVTDASNGTVTLDAGQVIYTPDPNFSGTDSFTYTVLDALGFTEETGTVTIEVASVNDAPTVVAIDLGSIAEDAAPQSFSLLQGVNDIDSDAAGFSIENVSTVQNGGTVTVATPLTSVDAATGQVTIDPSLLAAELDEGESATFQINYSVLDGDGASVANTASLTVTGVDDAFDGICVDTLDDVVADDGFTSLREAIAIANANDDVNAICFEVDGVINLRDDLQITSDVSIFGNDATIDAGFRDNIFDVNDRVTVDIQDLTLSRGASRSNGGAIDARNDATLNLTNVTFTDNQARRDGGAISVRDRSEINITGGSFNNNSARDDGGAISGRNDVAISIEGADFVENFARDDGGAISVISRAEIDVTGGMISENSVRGSGGGLAANDDAVIRLTDVALNGNMARATGGAIFVDDRGTVELIGGSLSNNEALREGGAIDFDDQGRLSIDGTNVEGNEAGSSGGVAYFDDRGSVDISGATIDGNTSGNEGGAFAFDVDGTVNVESSTISNNNALDDGGVFALDDNGSVTITDSLLLNNSTTRNVGDGAVIYVDNGNATVRISDTSAIGNTAGDDGGVIATEIDQPGAAFDIRITGDANDVFRGNSAGDDGGVIQVHNDSIIFIDGITIEDNEARDDGGVIAVNNNTELFVSTPSDIFSGSNDANDGDFLFSRNDISGEVQGFDFDTDFLIF